jgi:hypothetical protein
MEVQKPLNISRRVTNHAIGANVLRKWDRQLIVNVMEASKYHGTIDLLNRYLVCKMIYTVRIMMIMNIEIYKRAVPTNAETSEE